MNTTTLNMTTLDGGVIIKKGGGNASPTAPITENDVTFYDYDGKVLYAYTKEEFLALTAMPPLPTREGLICQEWNWEYDEATDFVRKLGMLNIGAMYVTDNGNTKIYIHFERSKTISLSILGSEYYIDWGDGTSDTATSQGTWTHEFSKGNYVIQIGGDYTLEKKLFTNTFDGIIYYNVELGGNIKYLATTFSNSPIKYISMPNGVDLGFTFNSNSPFANCYNLEHINIPKNERNASNLLNGCYTLKSVSMPSTQYNAPATFDMCLNLRKIFMRGVISCSGAGVEYAGFETPEETSISMSFKNCYALKEIHFGSQVNYADYYYAFQYCRSLRYVKLPTNKDVMGSMFSGCSILECVDFSDYSSIATLGSTTAFSGVPAYCKIIVPDALYDEWIAATNWSTYASYIIKKSEWDTLNA